MGSKQGRVLATVLVVLGDVLAGLWATTRAEVSSALETDGWRKLHGSGVPACFAKDVKGHRVVMLVYGEDPDDRVKAADLALNQFGFLNHRARCDDWY